MPHVTSFDTEEGLSRLNTSRGSLIKPIAISDHASGEVLYVAPNPARTTGFALLKDFPSIVRVDMSNHLTLALLGKRNRLRRLPEHRSKSSRQPIDLELFKQPALSAPSKARPH